MLTRWQIWLDTVKWNIRETVLSVGNGNKRTCTISWLDGKWDLWRPGGIYGKRFQRLVMETKDCACANEMNARYLNPITNWASDGKVFSCGRADRRYGWRKNLRIGQNNKKSTKKRSIWIELWGDVIAVPDVREFTGDGKVRTVGTSFDNEAIACTLHVRCVGYIDRWREEK